MTIADKKTTSLRIDVDTLNRLADICHKRESYNDVINKLIDHYHNFTIKPTTKNKRTTEEQVGNGLWASTNPIKGSKKK